MRLRTKFILWICLVVILSFGLTLSRIASLQERLVIDQALRQARMLHDQIVLTRKWIADHNGLFFLKQPGVEPNPYLANPKITDKSGREYVKRNPAMATRELSDYASKAGLFYYRVTTLKPINPANAPDEFERRTLQSFEQGVHDAMEIDGRGNERRLRYMAPLLVEESCLECHARQGYKVGDIRGGLSVIIPMQEAFATISANNRMLLIDGVAITLAVGLVLILLVEFLVVRRLARLALGMERYPDPSWEKVALPDGRDEVGRLAGDFSDLCHRLLHSGQELEQTRQQVFQNEKMAALGRLTAGIAHEINNPLGGMKNCVKGMRDSPEDRKLRERYLELVDRGLDRIEATVRQLLNFGRQEPLHHRRADIDILIRECFTLLEYGLKDVELTLDLAVGRECSLAVEGVKQVLVNIGLNAIQAMPEGGTLRVSSRLDHDRLVIVIEDTGIGMKQELLAKIFDPFFTTKEVGQGTGLGLSISYTLIERMGGTINVESEPGRGSRFILSLPVPAPEV